MRHAVLLLAGLAALGGLWEEIYETGVLALILRAGAAEASEDTAAGRA